MLLRNDQVSSRLHSGNKHMMIILKIKQICHMLQSFNHSGIKRNRFISMEPDRPRTEHGSKGPHESSFSPYIKTINKNSTFMVLTGASCTRICLTVCPSRRRPCTGTLVPAPCDGLAPSRCCCNTCIRCQGAIRW